MIAGASLYSIARQWNEAGLRTTQAGNLFDGPAVGRTLRNPRNAGLLGYKGTIVADADWPAIVDRERWRPRCT